MTQQPPHGAQGEPQPAWQGQPQPHEGQQQPWQGQPPQGHGQPQYGQQGQPQYGQQGQPQYGQPQYGQPQYGAPQGYAPQDTRSPEHKKLDSDSTLWMVAVLAGWFLAIMWVTGPLGWYMGSKLCKKYEALGMDASMQAKTAKIGGMITTALVILGVLATIAWIVFFFGILAVGAAAS